MGKFLGAALLWIPRIGGILFILFISMFALDIFGQGYSIWQTIVGLTVHLLPSIFLAIGLVLAWKREWIGALCFIAWALFYVATMPGFPPDVYVLIAGIPFVLGVFFWIGWLRRRAVRA